MLTMYCGIFYISGELDYFWEMLFFVLIVVANFYFLITWTYYFQWRWFVRLSKKFSFLEALRLEKYIVDIVDMKGCASFITEMDNDEDLPESRKEFIQTTFHEYTNFATEIPED